MIERGYFFNPIERDIFIVQGDTCAFGFQLQGTKGQEPSSIILTCRESIEADDALFGVSTVDTIDLRGYDEATDTFTYGVRIPPYLTQDIPLGRYFYDLQIAINEDVFTLMRGRFSVEYQVTLATVEPPPSVEPGDNLTYPREVEEGAIKSFLEETINNLAFRINVLNHDDDNEMTLADFDLLLYEDANLVESASHLINYYLENTTDYYLPDFSQGVTDLWTNREGLIDNSTRSIFTEVSTIAPYKFYKSNLTALRADDCQIVKENAFYECLSLQTFSLDSVEEIEKNGFYRCSALTDVLELPKLKTLGESAFYNHTYNGGAGFDALRLSNSALTGNETFEFNSYCLADNTGAVATSSSSLRWIDVDKYHYCGIVPTKPANNVESIEVEDSVIYNTPQTVDVYDGAIIFVEDENKPYVYEGGAWVEYIPEKSASFGTNCNSILHSTRVRDLGFLVGSTDNTPPDIFRGSRLLFLILDKNVTLNRVNSFWDMTELRALLTTDVNGDLTDVLPYTTLGGAFYKCSKLENLKLPYLETATDGTFRDSGLKSMDLPALTTFGKATNYQGFSGCSQIETITLGNGNNTLTFLGYSHFQNCSKLYSLTLNYTSVISLSASNQTMSNIFSGSPIYQYLGTTTTEITEGMAAGSVVIDGVTKSTSNGNIVSYGGEDWKQVSNKWTKWGDAQNKTPRILVPSGLISSYQSDAKWGTLSPEIWRAIM